MATKPTDIGDGIAVEWRQITYQSMEQIQKVYLSAIERRKQSKQNEDDLATISDVFKAEHELIRLVCKAVIFDGDDGERVRVDLIAHPEHTNRLPFKTGLLVIRSPHGPLVSSAKPSP